MFSPLKLLESKVPFAPYIKGERSFKGHIAKTIVLL